MLEHNAVRAEPTKRIDFEHCGITRSSFWFADGGPGIIEMHREVDSRGFGEETWHAAIAEKLGLPSVWLQDAISYSRRGVIRGMYLERDQARLVHCAVGSIQSVAVDL